MRYLLQMERIEPVRRNSDAYGDNQARNKQGDQGVEDHQGSLTKCAKPRPKDAKRIRVVGPRSKNRKSKRGRV